MAGPHKKSGGKTAAKHGDRKATGARKAVSKRSTKTKAKSRPAKKAALAAPAESRRIIAETTRQMLAAAAAACDEKKAVDTRILELDDADAGFTDFFLITSGTNERQTQTIADEVEMRLKRDFGTYPNSVEGKRQGEWVLLDYVDFVVHIFLAEKRVFYDIERLRKSAKHVDAVELQKALQKKTASTRKRVAAKAAAGSHAMP